MSAAKGYELKDLTITLPSGQNGGGITNALSDKFKKDKKNSFDIRQLAAEFIWYESIDSPFCRLDISIIESVDFINFLRGGEIVHL